MGRFGWIAFVLLVLATTARAADTPPPKTGAAPPASRGGTGDQAVDAISGAFAFRTHCATCHGAAGRGDGPLADALRFQPADLTLIARRNGGRFPTEKIVRIVDGRDPLKGHGGPDMPVWGDAFRNADTNYDDKAVREKVRSLVEYLRTIQLK
jgi:mono/diheme cytochrome c family protein